MYASSRIQLRRSFDRKIILIFTAIVLDAVSTTWLMYQGYGEANPIMNLVAKQWSPAGMAITKIIWSLALLSVILNYREFHKYVNHLIIGYFVLYAGGWSAQFIWEVMRTWTQ